MGTAVVHSCALVGIEAAEVRVEVHIGGGLPRITIVGLPEKSVNESRERVRAALKHLGFEIAPSHIIINLSPADLPKAGSRFDLPIALGILAASGQILPASLEGREFIGEMALTGELRSVRGVLAAAAACRHPRSRADRPPGQRPGNCARRRPRGASRRQSAGRMPTPGGRGAAAAPAGGDSSTSGSRRRRRHE